MLGDVNDRAPSRGVLVTAVASLGRGWRAVVVVAAATLVPLLALGLVVAGTTAGHDGLILNGIPWPGGAPGWPALLIPAVIGPTAVGLFAGGVAIVVRGDLDGATVDGITALRGAVRRWWALTALIWSLVLLISVIMTLALFAAVPF